MLSDGRLLFGIGGGWNAEEMENHGTDFKTRWKLLRERVLAMKEIWTKDEAEFHGEFVNFDPIWSWPKPVQKPHPPILMGGDTPKARQRVVDFCDGWIPIGFNPDAVLSGMKDLAERARAAGKKPEDFPVSVFGAPGRRRDHADVSPRPACQRVNFWVPPKPKEDVLPILDGYARSRRRRCDAMAEHPNAARIRALFAAFKRRRSRHHPGDDPRGRRLALPRPRTGSSPARTAGGRRSCSS